MSTIYLLHFVKPFGKRGIRHYLGRTSLALDDRLDRHRKGQGAALLRAVLADGNDFVLARTFPDEYNLTGYDLERALKKRYKGSGGFARVCPICLIEKELGGVLIGQAS